MDSVRKKSDGEREGEQEEEKRWRILLCIYKARKTTGTGWKSELVPDLWATFPCKVYLIRRCSRAGGDNFCLCIRVCTHVSNHRHNILWRYTPNPAHNIDRLQNGKKEQVKQTLKRSIIPVPLTGHRKLLVRLMLHRQRTHFLSFFLSLSSLLISFCLRGVKSSG